MHFQRRHYILFAHNLAELGSTTDIRDALDIDSMDFLRVVVALHDRLHVDIPERDYSKIRTINDCVAYLKTKMNNNR